MKVYREFESHPLRQSYRVEYEPVSKSVHWGNPGNINLKGKKIAFYTDDVIQNLKEKFNQKSDKKIIEDDLDYHYELIKDDIDYPLSYDDDGEEEEIVRNYRRYMEGEE